MSWGSRGSVGEGVWQREGSVARTPCLLRSRSDSLLRGQRASYTATSAASVG